MNSGRIEDIAAAILDYRGRTPPKSADGVKLLTAKVIKDGTIDETRLEYITEETYSWWMRRGFPQQWDILLTTEAPLGEVTLLRSTEPVALAQRVILLRCNPAIMDQLYLFAALRSPLMQDRLRQRATGTTVLGIKQRELRQVEVPLPPLPTQRKIASIFSAYDDLIENNNRRIKLLEELAQRVYRQWFVDFHYPGHENVPLVDSELGPIPRGWTVGTLSGVLSLLEAGSRPKGGIDPLEQGVPSIGAENVVGLGQYDFGKEKFVSRSFFDQMRRGHVASGDVVLYKDGAYIGRVSLFRDGFPHTQCAVNEHVFVLRVNERYSQVLLYFWLAHPSNRDRVRVLNANSAQPGLNQEKLRALTLTIPPPALVRRFTETVEPMMGLLFRLALATPCAREARDLLLPRLISGEVDVNELDIATPKAAE